MNFNNQEGAMGARVSGEMKAAQSLLWRGQSGYAASKATGISQGAISMSATCRSIIKAVKAAKQAMLEGGKTDAELLVYFTAELHIPENHAKFLIAQRAELTDEMEPAE